VTGSVKKIFPGRGAEVDWGKQAWVSEKARGVVYLREVAGFDPAKFRGIKKRGMCRDEGDCGEWGCSLYEGVGGGIQLSMQAKNG